MRPRGLSSSTSFEIPQYRHRYPQGDLDPPDKRHRKRLNAGPRKDVSSPDLGSDLCEGPPRMLTRRRVGVPWGELRILIVRQSLPGKLHRLVVVDQSNE